ncbi:MAG: hypothetical protein MUE81_11910 [Thermoflexibacter sp.]|jgi:hypothetical protein|nr:hypothetical protein [Thermoflexibacter sp.]
MKPIYRTAFNMAFFFTMAISSYAQNIPVQETKTSAYIGIVHPIINFTKDATTFNFNNSYLAGLTTAIIIKKAENYAYSLELVAFVRAQDGNSRTSNLMFHPGVTRFFKKNYAITPRLGFESNGRYGFTFVFTKTMFKVAKSHAVNFNLVNLYRFGAEQPSSITFAVNLTFGF